MKEPIMIAELLISGVLTLTWAFLGLAFFVDPKILFETIRNPGLGLTALFGLYAYAIGIISDRVWDFVTKPVDVRIRRRYFADDKEFNEARSFLLKSSPEAQESFAYLRLRLRVARAVVCSGPLIILIAAIGGYWGKWEIDRSLLLFGLGVLLLLVFAAKFAFRQISKNYYKRMKFLVEDSR